MSDAAQKGRSAKKLTERDVLTIHELHATGEWPQRALAKEFGVAQSTISRILRGRRWGWFKEKKR
jgi:IS30 family transposase